MFHRFGSCILSCFGLDGRFYFAGSKPAFGFTRFESCLLSWFVLDGRFDFAGFKPSFGFQRFESCLLSCFGVVTLLVSNLLFCSLGLEAVL